MTLTELSQNLAYRLPQWESRMGTAWERSGNILKTAAYNKFAWLRPVAEINEINDAFGAPFGTVDIYGDFLAKNLLGLDATAPIHLSQQAVQIKARGLPLPIYTAANPIENDLQVWFEFTPYECGWTGYNLHLPTWSFGRKFMYGHSQNQAPEQPLTTLLAVWGSAFTGQIRQMASWAPLLKDWRPFKKEFLNPVHGLDTTQNSPNTGLGKLDRIITIDAGLVFNLPYPSVAHRNPDIIIFIDASMDIKGNKDKIVNGNALVGAEKYAKEHNLKFPQTTIKLYVDGDAAHFSNSSMAIFISRREGEGAPRVIYMPLTKDQKLLEKQQNFTDLNVASFRDLNFTNYGTFKFNYSLAEANALMDLVEFNVRANEQWLKKVIREKLTVTQTASSSSSPSETIPTKGTPNSSSQSQAAPTKARTSTILTSSEIDKRLTAMHEVLDSAQRIVGPLTGTKREQAENAYLAWEKAFNRFRDNIRTGKEEFIDTWEKLITPVQQAENAFREITKQYQF